MTDINNRREQIIVTHAAFIVNVVQACQQPQRAEELEPVLQAAEEYGQQALVGAVRQILGGSRDASLLKPLDEDDAVIVDAILRGIQDPATLPDPDAQPDPSAAAPGLAAMIDAAASGNTEALQILANMAEQMSAAGGDMARLGGIMRALIDGERDPETLCKNMGPQGESLVLSILDALGKLEVH
jgi:hypothetical protein